MSISYHELIVSVAVIVIPIIILCFIGWWFWRKRKNRKANEVATKITEGVAKENEQDLARARAAEMTAKVSQKLQENAAAEKLETARLQVEAEMRAGRLA